MHSKLLPCFKHKRVLHARTLCALTAITAAAAQPGWAQGMGPPMQGSFEARVGLGVAHAPEYLGSDRYETRALPLLNMRWRNGFFAGFPSGIGFNFAVDQPLQYGLAVRADGGRDENDSIYLRGMGDIQSRPELSGFASYTLNDVTLRASLNYGAGNERDGLSLNTGITFGMPLAPRHLLNFSVDTTYVNESTMRSYFGVTNAQAQGSGYSLYTPTAGFRDVQAGLNYMHIFTPQWSLTAGLRATQLLGDAKDSPLTRSTNSWSALVGVGYRF
jgi:MipA family protein